MLFSEMKIVRQDIVWLKNWSVVSRWLIFALIAFLALGLSISLFEIVYVVIGPWISSIITLGLAVLAGMAEGPLGFIMVMDASMVIEVVLNFLHIDLLVSLAIAIAAFVYMVKFTWFVTGYLKTAYKWWKYRFMSILAWLMFLAIVGYNIYLPVDIGDSEALIMAYMALFGTLLLLYTRTWRYSLGLLVLIFGLHYMLFPIGLQTGVIGPKVSEYTTSAYSSSVVSNYRSSGSYFNVLTSVGLVNSQILPQSFFRGGPKIPKGAGGRGLAKGKSPIRNFVSKVTSKLSLPKVVSKVKGTTTAVVNPVAKPLGNGISSVTKPIRTTAAKVKKLIQKPKPMAKGDKAVKAEMQGKAKAQQSRDAKFKREANAKAAKARKTRLAKERKELVDSIKFEPKSVQHAYKHRAKTFGKTDNYNKANHAKFEAEVKNHMLSPETKVIKGAYHKKPATHFFNKETGVNVVTKEKGFVTTNKPTEKQVQHLLKDGNLGGGSK